MKRVRVILCASFVLFVYGSAFVDGAVLSGDGSSGNPYLIGNLADFNVFADPDNAATYWASGVHVQLTGNISLSGRSYNTAVIAADMSAATMTFDGPAYSGSFNGNGFEISGMTIVDDSGNSNIGLFGKVEYGVIENLGITNCLIDAGFHDFTVNHYVANIGVLSAHLYGGTVSNCYSTGTVKVTSHSTQQAALLVIGGLFGYFDSTMADCYSACSVTISTSSDFYSTISDVGGLCGFNEGSISNSYSTGAITVKGSKSVDANPYIYYKCSLIGGLCGKNYGNIDKCFSCGPVECSSNSFSDSILQYIGGLVGYNLYGSVSDSYTRSSVSAIAKADRRFAHCREIGGLIGYNQQLIENCYAAAAFSATVSGPYTNEGNQGGLCGGNSSTVTACFWDTDLSGMSVSAGGTGKSTGEMGAESLYTSAGWDFNASDGSADWVMNGGYPKLTWEAAYTVGLEDFAILAEYWQMTGCVEGLACDLADWYDDGTINVLDLLQLAKSWMGAEMILE